MDPDHFLNEPTKQVVCIYSPGCDGDHIEEEVTLTGSDAPFAPPQPTRRWFVVHEAFHHARLLCFLDHIPVFHQDRVCFVRSKCIHNNIKYSVSRKLRQHIEPMEDVRGIVNTGRPAKNSQTGVPKADKSRFCTIVHHFKAVHFVRLTSPWRFSSDTQHLCSEHFQARTPVQRYVAGLLRLEHAHSMPLQRLEQTQT